MRIKWEDRYWDEIKGDRVRERRVREVDETKIPNLLRMVSAVLFSTWAMRYRGLRSASVKCGDVMSERVLVGLEERVVEVDALFSNNCNV